MNIQDMKTEDLIALVSDENKQFSVQDLVDIINNASAKVQNKSDNVTYLFYSGKVNGEFSGVVAENLARDNRLFATVKDTPAGQLLESKEFKSALRKAIRLDKEKAGEPVNKNIVQDEFRRLTTNKSFGEKLPYDKDKLSLWDSVSKKYTEEIQKIDGKNANIRIILGDDVVANNASITDFKNSVFHQTELPALLQKSGITVDGISIDEIKKMPNPDSTIIANAMAISKLTNLSMGNTAEWANLTPEKTIELLKNIENNKEIQSVLKIVKEHWGDYVPENFGAYLADNKIAKNIPYAGLGILVLGMFSTNAQAKEAEAQGDIERAKEIWIEFALGEFGAEIAGAVATTATIFASIAVLGLSTPVAIVAGIAVGIGAGIWGEEKGKELYQLTKDLDKNGKADIFDRMGELFFGKDIEINQISEKLKTNISTLDANLSAKEITTLAKEEIAYRYALIKLNPFVFKGGIDYNKFNQNGELDLYSKDNPNGLTQTYLEKRAEMLTAWINKTSDLPNTYIDIDQEIRLQGTKVDYNAGNNGIRKSQSEIIFGGEKDDIIKAQNLGDNKNFLFGGTV